MIWIQITYIPWLVCRFVGQFIKKMKIESIFIYQLDKGNFMGVKMTISESLGFKGFRFSRIEDKNHSLGINSKYNCSFSAFQTRSCQALKAIRR